jgi:hypothetical protein
MDSKKTRSSKSTGLMPTWTLQWLRQHTQSLHISAPDDNPRAQRCGPLPPNLEAISNWWSLVHEHFVCSKRVSLGTQTTLLRAGCMCCSRWPADDELNWVLGACFYVMYVTTFPPFCLCFLTKQKKKNKTKNFLFFILFYLYIFLFSFSL